MKSYDYLCYCDLSAEENVFVLIPATFGQFYLKKSTPTYIAMLKSSDNIYIDTLLNSNGEKVGLWQTDAFQDVAEKSVYLSLDIYEMSGWDSFYYENATYYLTVDGKTIVSAPASGEMSNVQYTTSADGKYEYFSTISYDKDSIGAPMLSINVRLLTGQSYSEAIRALLETLGLSIKDSVVYDEIALIDAPQEAFTFDAYGLDGTETPSYDLYLELSSIYSMETITVDESMAFYEEEYIDETEQTRDGRYYFIFEPEISGGAVVDGESGAIDLSALSLTISAGVLAVDGGQYAAIIVATDGTDYTELARVTATYSGGRVVISGLTSLSLAALTQNLSSGEYAVKVYAARVSDGDDLKVSDLYDITAQGSYTLATDSYRVSITCGDGGISVFYEKRIVPVIESSVTYSEDGLNISAISACISSDMLAVKGDEYAMVLVADNGTAMTELSRVTATYISGGITLSGLEEITVGKLADFAGGEYALKLYIARVADGGDIVLSDYYAVNVTGGKTIKSDGYAVTFGCKYENEAVVYVEKYVTPTISGAVSVEVEQNLIQVSAVGVTLSGLAVNGGNYAAVILLDNGTTATEIDRITTVCADGSLAINGFQNIDVSGFASKYSSGAYTLKLYIVRADDGSDLVISDYYTLTANITVASDSYSYNGDSYTVSATNGSYTYTGGGYTITVTASEGGALAITCAAVTA